MAPGRMPQLFRMGALALALLFIVSGCSRAPQASLSAGGSHAFEGTWIASGTRSTISLGSDRRASVADLTGSLVLSGPSRPAAGFRAEAVILDDTTTGGVGRAVWTDDRGDQVYSELREEVRPTGNKIIGTIFGGTGRYAGATGTYDFSWQFLVETENGNVQGQSTGLSGRINVAAPSGSPQPGGQ